MKYKNFRFLFVQIMLLKIEKIYINLLKFNTVIYFIFTCSSINSSCSIITVIGRNPAL